MDYALLKNANISNYAQIISRETSSYILVSKSYKSRKKLLSKVANRVNVFDSEIKYLKLSFYF